MFGNNWRFVRQIERSRPSVTARLRGAPDYPEITGTVNFYQTRLGVIITAEVFGLPRGDAPCGGMFFGFHIHEGNACIAPAGEEAFVSAKGHLDFQGCDHPYHAGDLPPLLGNNGYAWSAVLSDRLTIENIRGRTVIVHRMPDDFRTQPSGDSGERIACGVIMG